MLSSLHFTENILKTRSGFINFVISLSVEYFFDYSSLWANQCDLTSIHIIRISWYTTVYSISTHNYYVWLKNYKTLWDIKDKVIINTFILILKNMNIVYLDVALVCYLSCQVFSESPGFVGV